MVGLMSKTTDAPNLRLLCGFFTNVADTDGHVESLVDMGVVPLLTGQCTTKYPFLQKEASRAVSKLGTVHSGACRAIVQSFVSMLQSGEVDKADKVIVLAILNLYAKNDSFLPMLKEEGVSGVVDGFTGDDFDGDVHDLVSELQGRLE
eukprot:TRINITY_DN2129_c0_g2_i3.p1 TRINITY_DN2129_c0_g2~~TRINITY_DN2129_c0_g2_i3.p1  ORF type:complete len:148 (+),score=45.93 TRINITY_DN2129_c0_g2_i3:109-552(+)